MTIDDSKHWKQITQNPEKLFSVDKKMIAIQSMKNYKKFEEILNETQMKVYINS